MADFLPSTFGQNFQQGWEQAQQRRDKNKLSQLYQQAYTAPEEQRSSILAQVAGMDPQAAESLEKRFNAQNEQHRKELVETARALTSAPEAYRPHVYQQLRQKLGGNFYGQPLPTEYGPDVAQAAEAILKSYGGSTTGDELKSLRVGANGNYWAIRGGEFVDTGTPAAQNLRPIDTGAGYYGFDPRTGGAAPVMIGGGQQQGHPPTASQGGSPYASLPPGLRITSGYRSPEENARLPNSVPNSFHTRTYADGSPQAIDVGTPTPEQQQAITQWANQNDYEVIRNYADGHWHLEPRGRQQGSGQAPQQLRSTPKPAAPSELDRRIEYARGMGASEDEIRRMVIGREGAAAGAKPMPATVLKLREETLSQAETAKTINTSLNKHLARIEQGELDFGPVANRLSEFRNFTGQSDKKSRNFAEFRSELEKLRNDSLRLNAGVQTDGDAQRAWNELFANINDTELVKQRLQTIRGLNERAEQLKRESVERIDEEYGGAGNSPAAAPQTNDARRKALLDKY